MNMKIERVNDNQIRCTLTREDLADRNIKLSELAYGTEKAKKLFRDMMSQASYEVGFDAENIPLMIEAIPTAGTLVLIITKVEDPEELDSRYSNFAPSVYSSDSNEDSELDDLISQTGKNITDVFDLLNKFKKEVAKNDEPQAEMPKESKDSKEITDEEVAFAFDSLASVIRAANVIDKFYHGRNSLYKNDQADSYILVLTQSEHTIEEFSRICYVLSEYGHKLKTEASINEAYYKEHGNTIIADNAIETLIQ